MIFEIKINRTWSKVTYGIFRSWSGERRVDGAPYHGPVVEFGKGLPNPWTEDDALKLRDKEMPND